MNADKALELARKAYPNNEELRVAYMLGLNEGYELHKEDMMREAVEGEVMKSNKYTFIRYQSVNEIEGKRTYPGDKVKLIIVKEEE